MLGCVYVWTVVSAGYPALLFHRLPGKSWKVLEVLVVSFQDLERPEK